MRIKKNKTVTLLELVELVRKGDMPVGFYESNQHTGEREYFIGMGLMQRDSDSDSRLFYSDRFDIDTEEELTEETPFPCRVVTIRTDDSGRFKGLPNSMVRDMTLIELKESVENTDRDKLDFIYQQNSDGSVGQLIWSKENGFADGTLEVSE